MQGTCSGTLSRTGSVLLALFFVLPKVENG